MHAPRLGNDVPRRLVRLWYVGVIVVVAGSLAVQVALLLTGGADANSGETGEVAPVGIRLARLFSFFTTDSNLVVIVVCLLVVIAPLRGRVWQDALHVNALVAITITGSVYALLIGPALDLDGWALVSMVGLHVVSPVAFVGGWLVLGPRPRMTPAIVGAAFVLPVAWIVATFVRGAIDGWYPYTFLDVNVLGLGEAARNAAVILAAAGVLAVLFAFLGRLVPTTTGRRSAS